MTQDINNAAPGVYEDGTQDLSGTTTPVAVLDVPQHLPKFWIYAEKGEPGDRFLDLGSESLSSVYGDETFNPDGKYYTHQTPFLELCVKNGNNCIVHRLTGQGSNDVANVALYLDILPGQVPLYEKNANGSLKVDAGGAYITQKDLQGNDITVAGYKVCWVVDHTEAALGSYEPGSLNVRPGIQTSGGTQSMQYPIREVCFATPGEYGDKVGLRFYPAVQSDMLPFPTSYLNDAKVYPYYFQLVKLVDSATGKVEPVNNGYGSQFSRFASKAKAKDPTTGLAIDFERVVAEQYINSPAVSAGLGRVISYDANIQEVLQLLYDAEKVTIDASRDSLINTTENNIHAINMLGFTSSNGSPYNAIKLVDVAGSTRMTRSTNIFLSGGNDGTMTEALMDDLVGQDLAKYNDATHEYMDLVAHPESIIYDSGFGMNTKKLFPKFISRRKDTFAVSSSFAYNNSAYLLADQYSAGIALKTMYEMYPESETFGTGVMRGIVLTGSGEQISGTYRKRLPLSYELLYMASRYMGAKNGAWKNGYVFDRAPRNIFTQLKNVDVTWVPSATRTSMWAAGLNFALNYKVKTPFFPALQTVYDNDTSVLNSFFTCVAISYLNKVEHAAWRQFTGNVTLTPAQLEEEVNKFVSESVKDKFDGMFVIVPACKVTEADKLRGYKWTLPIKLYANNMQTVMSTYVQAYRMSDLTA